MKTTLVFMPFLFLACAHKPNMALTTPADISQEEASLKIDREGVRQAIRESLPEFKGCYEATVAADKNAPEGKINLAWQIHEDGIVHYAVVNEERSTMRHAKLENCMLSVLQKIKMPAPPPGVVAEVAGYPFSFEKTKTQK